MAYIEVRTTLPAHKKVRMAARELGVSRYELIGHLVCLWAWALENVPSSGSLHGLTDADLEDAAGWPEARTGLFMAALTSVAFVDVEPDGRYLHDWDDYAGRLLKRREADRDRKREERATARNGAHRSRTRRADTPASPADKRARPHGQRPMSAASRAPAGARTAPHRTVGSRELEEVPTAREPRPPRSARGSSSVQPDDPRHQVEQVLLGRYGWKRITKAQWARMDELVDNEYPTGTTAGADRQAAWRWLAELMEALPPDAGDPLEAAFTEVNWRIAVRRATAEMGAMPKPNGTAHSRSELVASFRPYRGLVPDDALARQLSAHGLTLDDLDGIDEDEGPDFGAGPEPTNDETSEGAQP